MFGKFSGILALAFFLMHCLIYPGNCEAQDYPDSPLTDKFLTDFANPEDDDENYILPEPEYSQQAAAQQAAAQQAEQENNSEPGMPQVPEYIMGQGQVDAKSLSDFLLFFNPDADGIAEELANLYVEEASAEGVNCDAAFAQMCLETGFLRFGGLVTSEMNNFCGLGAIGPGQEGEWFPDPRTGVRAHIQHLKIYASDEPLNQELVDPRNYFVISGSSPKISGLSGTWAADPAYGDKITNLIRRIYEYSFLKNNVITAIQDTYIPETSEAEIEPQIGESDIIKGADDEGL
ncbi:MAG: glucosaminidase domain-containing protein [Treponema sp.]|nr:glucosaminidase domain-containing protein [Treponema sp.]